jgi:hypothetical protein
MPPKSTALPQRTTRSAAATRLDIAQGKAKATRKQPGANASQASATAPPPSSPAAQRKSRHQPPHPNTASAASTRAKPITTHSTFSKGNTGASATGCAEGEGAATHSPVAEANSPPQFSNSVNTGCAEGEAPATATHRAEAVGNSPHQFPMP